MAGMHAPAEAATPPDAEADIGQAVSSKVPRNAPCPCGSGKKFKQCHGRPGAVGLS
ncbi:hypothetical protein BH18ACT16_BH18ACT16_12770 [soil metagenome]